MAETVEHEIQQESGSDLDNSKGEEFRGDSDEVSGGSLSEEDGQRRSGSDNEQRRRRLQRRHKGGKKHHRKRTHPYKVVTNHSSLWKSPEDYTHAPRNTTQYLIEDHVRSKMSPNLSQNATPDSNDDRAARMEMGARRQPLDFERERQEGGPQDSPHLSLPFTASERKQYDQEFVSAYDDVNEDKLITMSKEQLIRVTSRLLQRMEEKDRAPVAAANDRFGEETNRRRDSEEKTVGTCK